jgi:hypothetical protein
MLCSFLAVGRVYLKHQQKLLIRPFHETSYLCFLAPFSTAFDLKNQMYSSFFSYTKQSSADEFLQGNIVSIVDTRISRMIDLSSRRKDSQLSEGKGSSQLDLLMLYLRQFLQLQ